MVNGALMGHNNKIAKTLHKNDINLLKHLINYSLNNMSRKYDEYIYNTWNTFRQKKKVIIMNSHYLNESFSKEILDLLMYDLVPPWSKKKKELNSNICRELLLLLFPNIQKIMFYTTNSAFGRGHKEYRFSFSSFFDLFWRDILFKHKTVKTIKIKGKHNVLTQDRSWIFSEFSSYNKELNKLNQTQFKIKLNITNDSIGNKEDTLSIDRL